MSENIPTYSRRQVSIESLKQGTYSHIQHSTNHVFRKTIFQPSLKDGGNSADGLMLTTADVLI